MASHSNILRILTKKERQFYKFTKLNILQIESDLFSLDCSPPLYSRQYSSVIRNFHSIFSQKI